MKHPPLTFAGETKTVNAWARDPRVSVATTTIRDRKAVGWSDERALFAPAKNCGGKVRHRLSYRGETKSAWAWAKDPEIEIAYTTILQRKRLGWSDEETLGTPAWSRSPYAANEPLLEALALAGVPTKTIAEKLDLSYSPLRQFFWYSGISAVRTLAVANSEGEPQPLDKRADALIAEHETVALW